MSEQRRTRLDFDADLVVTRTDDPPEAQQPEVEPMADLIEYLAEVA